MSKLVPVTSKNHGNRRWQRFTSYAFASVIQYAPLVAAELHRAVQAMPIGFIRQAEHFYLAGVLSLVPGDNLFVDHQGRWLGEYVPSVFRGHPFKLAKMEEQDKLVLCVDEDSGLISDTTGEPFFDENSQLAPPVLEVRNFLEKVAQNSAATQQAVNALAMAGVLVPWPVRIDAGDEAHTPAGLYRVDEAGLSRLDDTTFLKLRTALALPVAYAQLFSMAKMGMLKKLAEFRKRQQPQPPGEVDLEKLFGPEDDILRFS